MFLRFIFFIICLLFVLIMSGHKCDPNVVQHVYANTNGAITLPCNFSEEADKMRWFFQQNPGGKETFAFDNKILPYEGYAGSCDGSKRHCNLVINIATKDLAGRYRFEFGQKGDHMKSGCIYELIVGNLECTSNIRNNRIIIGESECPVKPETIMTSCSFHHRGNIGDNLRFVWLKKKSEYTILRHKILTEAQDESQGNEQILTVKDEFPATNDLQGTTFRCTLERLSNIIPCKLPVLSVQYVKSFNQPKSLLTNLNHFESITCVLNKSESLKCSYHWLHQHLDRELKIQSQHLSKEHLVMTGDYKCIASCQFVTGKTCCVSGSLISFSGQESCKRIGYIVSILILCLLLLAVLLVSVVLLMKKKKKSLDKFDSGQLSVA